MTPESLDFWVGTPLLLVLALCACVIGRVLIDDCELAARQRPKLKWLFALACWALTIAQVAIVCLVIYHAGWNYYQLRESLWRNQ